MTSALVQQLAAPLVGRVAEALVERVSGTSRRRQKQKKPPGRKTKRKSRRSYRRARSANMGGGSVGKAMGPYSRITAPTNMDPRIRSAKSGVSSAPRHEDWGEGIRVNGEEIIANLANPSVETNGIVQLTQPINWTIDTSAPSHGFVPYFPLHPAICTRLRTVASAYGRFAFRKVCVRFHSTQGTGSAGVITIGYTRDMALVPESGYTVLSSAAITQLDPSFTTSVWNSNCMDLMAYTGKQTWQTSLPDLSAFNEFITGFTNQYTDTQFSDICDQFFQGMIFVGSGGVASTPGFLHLEYTVDFYMPTIPTGLQLSGTGGGGGLRSRVKRFQPAVKDGTTLDVKEKPGQDSSSSSISSVSWSSVVGSKPPETSSTIDEKYRIDDRLLELGKVLCDLHLTLKHLRPSSRSEKRDDIPDPPPLVRQEGYIL